MLDKDYQASVVLNSETGVGPSDSWLHAGNSNPGLSLFVGCF